MEAGICKDCRFWEGDAYRTAEGALRWMAYQQKFGLCLRHTRPNVDDPAEFRLVAITGIPSPDIATKPDFGCVLHKGKLRPDRPG